MNFALGINGITYHQTVLLNEVKDLLIPAVGRL